MDSERVLVLHNRKLQTEREQLLIDLASSLDLVDELISCLNDTMEYDEYVDRAQELRLALGYHLTARGSDDG